MRKTLLDKISEFENYSELHSQGVPIADIRAAIKTILSPYVRNRSLLDSEHIYFGAGEAINVGRIVKEEEGANFLLAISDIYWASFDADPDASTSLIAELDSYIEGGKQKYVNASLLEVSKGGLDTETLAHECLRSIGTIIEGSIRPFLDELLCLLHIETNGVAPQDTTSMTLGQLVAALQKTRLTKSFLFPKEYGVSLSQWRNIAQHLSFTVDKQRVLATYGTTKKKTVVLEHSELIPLTRQLLLRLGVLKGARNLFCWQNIDRIGPRLSAKEENEDSILIDLSAMFLTQGFRVRDFETSDHSFKLVLEDLRAKYEDPNKRAIHASQFLAAIGRRIHRKSLSVEYHDPHRDRKCQFTLNASDANAVLESENPLHELARRIKLGKSNGTFFKKR